MLTGEVGVKDGQLKPREQEHRPRGWEDENFKVFMIGQRECKSGSSTPYLLLFYQDVSVEWISSIKRRVLLHIYVCVCVC